MLPAYCDPPNPCPIGYTAQVSFSFLISVSSSSSIFLLSGWLHWGLWKQLGILTKVSGLLIFPRASDWQLNFRLLRTVCATLSICLHVPSQSSRCLIINLQISGKKREHKVSHSIQLCGVQSTCYGKHVLSWPVGAFDKSACYELKANIPTTCTVHISIDVTARLFWVMFHSLLWLRSDIIWSFTFFGFFGLASFSVFLFLISSIWPHCWSEWRTLLPWWFPFCWGSQGPSLFSTGLALYEIILCETISFRIHSLLGQSCRLQQRRGWATRSSQPSPGKKADLI